MKTEKKRRETKKWSGVFVKARSCLFSTRSILIIRTKNNREKRRKRRRKRGEKRGRKTVEREENGREWTHFSKVFTGAFFKGSNHNCLQEQFGFKLSKVSQ